MSVSQSVSYQGGHRAARAAKKTMLNIATPSPFLMILQKQKNTSLYNERYFLHTCAQFSVLKMERVHRIACSEDNIGLAKKSKANASGL